MHPHHFAPAASQPGPLQARTEAVQFPEMPAGIPAAVTVLSTQLRDPLFFSSFQRQFQVQKKKKKNSRHLLRRSYRRDCELPREQSIKSCAEVCNTLIERTYCATCYCQRYVGLI
jgi:hypothetical protein